MIHFYDRAWGDEFARLLDDMRAFLQTLNDSSGARFATLSAEEQDATLRDHESDGRFEVLRVITMFGFFTMEKYGGNKGHVGWDVIGFEGHHGGWAPPFGYYDAKYMEERDNDE